MSDMIPPDQGRIVTVRPANPAVGDEITIQQPSGVRWRVTSFIALRVNGVVAGDRSAVLVISQGGDVLFRSVATALSIASQVIWYVWSAGSNPLSGTGQAQRGGVLPNRLLVNDQTKFETDVWSADAGDQWSDIVLMVEEWMEPLA